MFLHFIPLIYTPTSYFAVSTLLSTLITVNTTQATPFISSYFITAQTAFRHCTFSFITAHFVHHCTLKVSTVLYLSFSGFPSSIMALLRVQPLSSLKPPFSVRYPKQYFRFQRLCLSPSLVRPVGVIHGLTSRMRECGPHRVTPSEALAQGQVSQFDEGLWKQWTSPSTEICFWHITALILDLMFSGGSRNSVREGPGRGIEM